MAKPKTQTLQDNKTPNADLQKAFETITQKKAPYDILYAYYRGNHPLRYSTERLKKAFGKIGTYFAQNWISVIVDAVLDRMNLKGFDIQDTAADDKIMELWEQYHLHLLADDTHEAATVLGEGYVIAWRETNDKEEEITDVYYNDPRMCHMFYDPYRPTEKLYAAKMWVDKEYHPCMLLYYPDRLEHYKSPSKMSQRDAWVGSAGAFQPDTDYGDNGVEPNEYGIIPVFHFRSGRVSGKREIGQSEISLQDAVNKLFADMMVSSEFTTFTQRVIISQGDPGDLKNSPGSNWWIPAGDGKGQSASVTELGDKSLDNYIQAINSVAQSLAIISRTPKHYLMLNGSDPSGDALLAMEAPLNKKVKKRIEGYEVEWKALVKFLLQLEGIEVEAKDITPVWEPVSTQQPLASAQTVGAETSAGIPLVTALRRQGWASDEIEQMEEDDKAQQKKKTSIAQTELDMQRNADAQNNTNPDGSGGSNGQGW
jgi:hypothetical protein